MRVNTILCLNLFVVLYTKLFFALDTLFYDSYSFNWFVVILKCFISNCLFLIYQHKCSRNHHWQHCHPGPVKVCQSKL